MTDGMLLTARVTVADRLDANGDHEAARRIRYGIDDHAWAVRHEVRRLRAMADQPAHVGLPGGGLPND